MSNPQQKSKADPKKEGSKKSFGEKARDFFGETVYENLLLIDTLEPDDQELEGEDLIEVLEALEEFIRINGHGITMTQLRNIFTIINEVEMGRFNQLLLLQPKLKLIAARQKKYKAKLVCGFLEDLIKQVKTERHFTSLLSILKAIISYHKYYVKSNK